ncbi:putative surface protease GP63 [Trypanosoma cruzi]|nr:putative surface protease GP63 [Trypanosoma cruzi]
MAHALGFDCPHLAGRSMVRNAIGVRGRALSVVVDSTNAAMAASEHQDCDEIDGVELQDDDGDGRMLESHWSRRHARDEWIAPIVCELLQRKCSALNMSEYRHMLCDVGVPVKRCASDRYSRGRGWYLGVSMKCQPNARWTVAPSLIPHWM